MAHEVRVVVDGRAEDVRALEDVHPFRYRPLAEHVPQDLVQRGAVLEAVAARGTVR